MSMQQNSRAPHSTTDGPCDTGITCTKFREILICKTSIYYKRKTRDRMMKTKENCTKPYLCTAFTVQFNFNTIVEILWDFFLFEKKKKSITKNNSINTSYLKNMPPLSFLKKIIIMHTSLCITLNFTLTSVMIH